MKGLYKAIFKRKRPDGTIADYECPVWHYRFQIEGATFKGSTGTTLKTKAMEIVEKRKVKAREECGLTEVSDINFADFTDKYYQLCASKMKTAEDKREILDDFKECFGNKLLSRISPFHVKEYLANLRNKKNSTELSPARRNRYRSELHRLFEVAIKWKLASKNPVSFTERERENNKRDRFLSPDELQRLLSLPESEKLSNGLTLQIMPLYLKRHIIVAINTLMRQGEQFSLKWNQVDLRTGYITLTDTKNGETRKVPMNSEVVKIMRELKAEQFASGNRSEYVFGDRSNMNAAKWAWKNALKEAGIENFRWHDLRHTGASYLAMSGKSLRTIMQMGGWKSMDMVLRYSHLSESHIKDASEDLGKIFSGIFNGSGQNCPQTAHNPQNGLFLPLAKPTQPIVN